MDNNIPSSAASGENSQGGSSGRHAPAHFFCPLLHRVMTDPVFSMTTGLSFEHSAILAWKSLRGHVCPITGGDLGTIAPNVVLAQEILRWKQNAEEPIPAVEHQPPRPVVPIPASDASSYLAHQRILSRTTRKPSKNHKPKMQRVDPKCFEEIIGFVQVFTSHEADVHKEEFESDKAHIQPYRQPTPSIFRRGPTLTVPKT